MSTISLAGVVSGAGGALPIDPQPTTTDAPATEGASAFERVLDAVNDSAAAANDATVKMVDGTGDVHEAMIALQQADLTLQFAVQVRNKLVSAYQEISRMPV
jgi:flagellar hook-basal body complex protein FliE